ncbi:MAG: carbohydrate kinase family protein [Planctomycetota bacterium]|jgi:sugar/nucleoside kinase (ribokinase family)
MDVLCVGILVADVVARPVRGMPERGTLDLVSEIQLHSGGCAANTGVALAKIGVSAGIAGKVGRDPFGDFLEEAVRKHGLDVGGVVRDPQEGTSATVVLVDAEGERTFIHYAGANRHFRESDIDLEAHRGCKILHLAGSLLMRDLDGEPSARLLKRAREMGMVTSMDTAWDATGRWMETVGPCLPHTDIFMASLEEAKRITGCEKVGEIAGRLREGGAGAVALKMGERGCFIEAEGETITLPAFPVEVVDTTGAGDAFAAGFLAGRVHEWSWEKTARFACATGALCCTRLGATEGIKSLEETEGFLRMHGG